MRKQKLTSLYQDLVSRALLLLISEQKSALPLILKSKLQELQNLKKEQIFRLNKDLRDYKLYHAREIRRLTPELKAKIANLKEQKSQLLTTISNLEEQISQKEAELVSSLAKNTQNKTQIASLKTELDSNQTLLEKTKKEAKKLTSEVKDLQKSKQKLSEQFKNQEQELLNQIQDLNTKQNKALLLANHRQEQINSLSEQLEQEKTALIALAKKKIQNKKEFQQLLEQLQAKWESEREQFHSEIKALEDKDSDFVADLNLAIKRTKDSCQRKFEEQISDLLTRVCNLDLSPTDKDKVRGVRLLLNLEI